MIRNLLFIYCLFTAYCCIAGKKQNQEGFKSQNHQYSFMENKGQISDQYNKPRPDILFSGTTNEMAFHLRNNGISYQFTKTLAWREIDIDDNGRKENFSEKRKAITQSSIYRLDINWLNCNTSSIIKKGEALAGYNNYYSEVCHNGVHHVMNYKEITYQNIYKGIDLKWYQKHGSLKYDYLVSAGADYEQIKLEIKGAEEISLNTKGELVIKTPLGTIIEQAPVVKQMGRLLKSKWVINNSIVSFFIENLNPKNDFIIDPAVRAWGTYYGDIGDDGGYSCTTDANNNVYMVGYASLNAGTAIATVGSHQIVYGGGFYDAFLVKFDPNGVRQWATSYGGSAIDEGNFCTTDASGNVYIAGYTASNTGTVIATAGSHQSTHGGGTDDAFLVKFDPNGLRLWGTYYGGTGNDRGKYCTTDAGGNIYMTGETNSNTGTVVATIGSHQAINGGGGDGFLVKFNSNGQRQWGTYYGGSGSEVVCTGAIDAGGNIYLTGQTSSSVAGTEIATPGSHQPTFAGVTADAFLVKFNSGGVRQWGTYYGGTGSEFGFSCATDISGNVYIAGYSNSNAGTVIATPGSHQPSFAGGSYDAFLVKFSTNGVRQWGTYYGDAGNDFGKACFTDNSNNIYILGTTTSTGTMIATAGSHQTINAGGNDAFLVQFNPNGQRQWGTYYGDYGQEQGVRGTSDGGGNVYLVGYTYPSPGTILATAGSHQPNEAGATDGFLVKFFDCSTPPASPANTTPIGNQTICTGNSTTLNTASSGTISWFATPSSTTVLNTGSVFITPTLSTGTYTYYAEALTCLPSATRTAITIIVNALPIIGINTTNSFICIGETATLVANGANSYLWSTGTLTASLVVSPTITTSYTVIGTNTATGCYQTATISVSVDQCTGINNAAFISQEAYIHPNPNNGEFILELKNGSIKNIEIYDLTGRIVFTIISREDKVEINIKSFVNGVYYLKVQYGDVFKVVKIIKQ